MTKTVRLGPFTGGIDRISARTKIPSTSLFDAQGVFQVERGRLRACWEGETSEFPIEGLTNGTASVSKAPVRGIYWRGLIADDATKTEPLVFASKYICSPASETTQISYVNSADGDAEKEIWVHEFLSYLIVCVDGEPMRFIRPENYDDTKNYAANDKGSTFLDWVDTDGQPGYIYFDRTDGVDGTVNSTTPPQSGVRFTYSGANGATGAHGAALAMTGGTDYIYTTQVLFNRRHTTQWHPDTIDGGNYFVTNSGAANDNLDSSSITLMPPSDGVRWRIGKLMQQVAARFPATYKNRFCFVEGRDWEYSALLDGQDELAVFHSQDTFKLTSTGSSPYPDYRAGIARGDELIIFHAAPVSPPGPPSDVSDVKDYVISTENTQTYTIKQVYYSSSTTYIELETDHDFDNSQNYFWAVRRQLSAESRRAVWFSGAAASAADGTPVDITDFTTVETSNFVIVGSDRDGDITALVPQFDQRMIVGLENAIYEIVGNPPIDGVPPPGFGVNTVALDIGIYKDTAVAFDETGQRMFFGVTGGGVAGLYGATVVRIDQPVTQHENFRNKSFSHLVFVDYRLYCLTDETDPYIWIFDTLTESWTYTQRVNSGQGQEQSDGAALELSDGSYASNKLYDATGGHGGIFAPYRGVSGEEDRLLVVYSDGTDFNCRSMNHIPDEHNEANLLHGVKVQTGYVDGGSQAPKRIRQVRALNTKPLVDDNGGAAFSEAKIAATTSEGDTTLSRDLTPDLSDSQGDSEKYRCQGAGGRGDTSISVTINDGISPMGELDSVEIDVAPLAHRSR